MTKCNVCINSHKCKHERKCEFQAWDYKVIKYANERKITVTEAVDLLRFCIEHEPEKKNFEEEESC